MWFNYFVPNHPKRPQFFTLQNHLALRRSPGFTPHAELVFGSSAVPISDQYSAWDAQRTRNFRDHRRSKVVMVSYVGTRVLASVRNLSQHRREIQRRRGKVRMNGITSSRRVAVCFIQSTVQRDVKHIVPIITRALSNVIVRGFPRIITVTRHSSRS